MFKRSFKLGASQAQSTILVGLVLFVFAPTALAKRVLIDQVQAVINNEPILYSEIKTKEKFGPLVALSPYPSKQSASNFEKSLNDSINIAIMLEEAETLGIAVDDAFVESSIDKFLAGQNSNRKALTQYLKSQGRSFEAYKVDFEQQITLQRFQQRVIVPQISVTDQDIQSLYDNSAGMLSKKQTLDIRQLVISGSKKRAEEIYAKLATMSFADAVRQYSSGSKSNGGLVRNMKMRDMAPGLQPILASIPEGKYGPLIPAGAGHFVFYVEKRRASNKVPLEQVKPQLEMQLKQKALMEKTSNWLAEKRAETNIKMFD